MCEGACLGCTVVEFCWVASAVLFAALYIDGAVLNASSVFEQRSHFFEFALLCQGGGLHDLQD